MSTPPDRPASSHEASITLTALPAEIQEEILRYLLVNPGGHIVNPYGDVPSGPPLTIGLSILRANRSLYQIGSHVLYHENTFRFSDQLSLSRWLSRRPPRSPSTLQPLSTHTPSRLHLQLDFRPYHTQRLPSDLTSTRWYWTLEQAHRAAPRLERLVLWFRAMDSRIFDVNMLEPREMAETILSVGIRELRELRLVGLPSAYEAALMPLLRPMMASRERDPATIWLPAPDSEGL